MSDQNALPGFQDPPEKPASSALFGEGPTETETRLAIAEIEAEKPVTGSRRTIKQLCLSLAKSIDRGNSKGRAIANEAAQLFAMMQQLDPPEDAAADLAALSPDLQRLFDALSAPAQFDPAPARDRAEL